MPCLKKHKEVDFEIPVLESYDPEKKVGLQSVGTCSCSEKEWTKCSSIIAEKIITEKKGRSEESPTFI